MKLLRTVIKKSDREVAGLVGFPFYRLFQESSDSVIKGERTCECFFSVTGRYDVEVITLELFQKKVLCNWVIYVN